MGRGQRHREESHVREETVTIHLRAKEGKHSGDLQKLGKGMGQIALSLQVREVSQHGYGVQLKCSLTWCSQSMVTSLWELWNLIFVKRNPVNHAQGKTLKSFPTHSSLLTLRSITVCSFYSPFTSSVSTSAWVFIITAFCLPSFCS